MSYVSVRRAARTSESAPNAQSTAKAQSDLFAIHSAEFASGLADFGCPTDLSNEANTVAENRLAMNVVWR
jgi:hypothetical protein